MLKKFLVIAALGIAFGIAYLFFQLAEKYKLGATTFAGVISILVGFGMAFYSVPEVIKRMKDDSAVLLSDAIVHTFYSHMMLASFVPIVGPVFGKFIERKRLGGIITGIIGIWVRCSLIRNAIINLFLYNICFYDRNRDAVCLRIRSLPRS